MILPAMKGNPKMNRKYENPKICMVCGKSFFSASFAAIAFMMGYATP